MRAGELAGPLKMHGRRGRASPAAGLRRADESARACCLELSASLLVRGFRAIRRKRGRSIEVEEGRFAL
jgi:hypothetical protein